MKKNLNINPQHWATNSTVSSKFQNCIISKFSKILYFLRIALSTRLPESAHYFVQVRKISLFQVHIGLPLYVLPGLNGLSFLSQPALILFEKPNFFCLKQKSSLMANYSNYFLSKLKKILTHSSLKYFYFFKISKDQNLNRSWHGN